MVQWYLDTVYPELFIPGEAVGSGELRNLWQGHGSQMCVDSPAKKADLHKPVGLYPCHKQVMISTAFLEWGTHAIDHSFISDSENLCLPIMSNMPLVDHKSIKI